MEIGREAEAVITLENSMVHKFINLDCLNSTASEIG
jgi:hypothetical protein